ncbi:hypothetical protein LCGC14_2499590, partial [marine sediment metagenome]
MAVIDLRGDVARSLASLGVSVGGIISPHKKEKKEFRNLIARNPQLVGAFSRMERQSPGAVREIFPFLDEEMITSITSAPPSPEELGEAIEIPALIPVEQGGTLTPEAAETLGKFAVTERFGTTPAAAALEPKRVIAAEAIPQEAVTAGLRREVTGLTTGQRAQDEFNTEIFNVAMDSFNALGLEEADAAALRDKLPATFFDADAKLAHERRLEITNLQITAQTIDRANERLDAFRMGVASRWVNKTNVGLPETWQLFLYSKDANDRAKLLQSRADVPENESDISLLEVADAFARAKDADKIIEQAAANRQIPILIERIEKRDSDGNYVLERSVRVALVEQLNFVYMEASALSEGRLPFRKAEIPAAGRFFGKNKALVVLDESGQEIEQSARRLEELREQATQAPLELNLETVDASRLSPITRRNLIKIMNGEGTFEELQAF